MVLLIKRPWPIILTEGKQDTYIYCQTIAETYSILELQAIYKNGFGIIETGKEAVSQKNIN